MNILEAKKLAERGYAVIAPNGQEFLPADFDTDDAPWLDELVFGEWTVKREPLRLWAVYDSNDRWIGTSNDIRGIMKPKDGERMVEFVEVIK